MVVPVIPMIVAYVAMTFFVWWIAEDEETRSRTRKSEAFSRLAKSFCWAWPVVVLVWFVLMLCRGWRSLKESLTDAWEVLRDKNV